MIYSLLEDRVARRELPDHWQQLPQIVAANKDTLLRAQDLNRRAGRPVFAVSVDDVAYILQSQLEGARRCAEVQDVLQLALPPLDQNLVDQVLAEAPDEIEIAGEKLPVSYQQYGDGVRPVVTIRYTAEQSEAGAYEGLPNDNVHLPNGQLVNLEVFYNGISWERVVGNNVIFLKQKIQGKLFQQKWEAFKLAHRDKVPLPNPANPTSSVAELVEIVGDDYGISGICFGTVEGIGPYTPWFRVVWFQDKCEAEEARQKAITALAEYKEVHKQREKAAAAVLASHPAPSLGGLGSGSYVSSTPFSPSGFGRSSRNSRYGIPERRVGFRWGGKKGPGANAPSSKFKAAQARMLELAEDNDVNEAGLSTKLRILGQEKRPKGEDALKQWLDNNISILDRAEVLVDQKRHERQLAEMQPKLESFAERLIESDGSNKHALQEASDLLEEVERLIKEGQAKEELKDDSDEEDNSGKIDDAYALMSELERLVEAACQSA